MERDLNNVTLVEIQMVELDLGFLMVSNGAIFVKNIDVSKSYGRNATDQ
jgi:hypothetical protein